MNYDLSEPSSQATTWTWTSSPSVSICPVRRTVPSDQTTRMTSSMVELVRIAYMIVITAVLSASTTENWGEVLYLSSEIFYFHSEDF